MGKDVEGSGRDVMEGATDEEEDNREYSRAVRDNPLPLPDDLS